MAINHNRLEDDHYEIGIDFTETLSVNDRTRSSVKCKSQMRNLSSFDSRFSDYCAVVLK